METQILQFILGKGSGEATLRKFLDHSVLIGEEGAKALLRSPKTLMIELGINESIASSIINSREDAEKMLAELDKHSVKLIWKHSKSYPERINGVLGKDTPPVLFTKGNIALFKNSSVGFCGSRNTSKKGIWVAGQCAESLAQDGYSVVSGYASGVDMAAHKAALQSGGNTIIVLAEGILRYQQKKEIKEFFYTENHLIVSQFPPNLSWLSRNAMKRNSTIIGLSDVMILVESGMKGGTFAAGKETLKRNRPLFVIDFLSPDNAAEANQYFIMRGGSRIRKGSAGLPDLSNVKQAIEDESCQNKKKKNSSMIQKTLWND